MEKWESESLKWIHEVRERSYKETEGKNLREIAKKSNENAKSLIKAWGLKVRHPIGPR